MAGKDFTYNLKLLTDLASVQKASGAVEDLTDDLDDTSTAAQKMAKVLKAAAADVEKALREDAEAADALAQALGPELAAKTDTMAIVQELKQVGITCDDVKADAVELADAIKKVDDVNVQLDNVKGGFKKVGAEADNTRSVVANFTGNTLSELPGVTNAFGPLNMAIGQFGEYAAEGNIKLANLAKAAGPLAGVAVGVQIITSKLEAVAKVKAFRKEQVEDWAEAIKDAGDDVQQLTEHLRESGEIKAYDVISGEIKDFTRQLLEARVGVDLYTELIAGGKEAIDEWAAAQVAAGNGGEDLVTTTVALYEGAAQYQLALDKLRVSQEFAAERAYKTNQSLEEQAVAMSETEREARRLDPAIGAVTTAMKNADNQTKWLGEQYDALTDKFSDRTDWLNLSQDIDAAKARMADTTLTAEEQELAWIDLRQKIIDYTTASEDIPAEIKSHVMALVDQGSVEHAETILRILERDRKVTYFPKVNTGKGGVDGEGLPHGATGGIVTRPTVALIGEAGPEAVVPLNRTPGSSPLSGMGGGMNVTINGAHMTPDQIVNAIKRFEKRNGPGWRT